MATADEKRETIEEVLEMMDECARLLRSLGNPRIDAYCLADFEGREGGWLGEFVRDIIEQEQKALDEDDDEVYICPEAPCERCGEQVLDEPEARASHVCP